MEAFVTRDPVPQATRAPSIVLEDVRLTLASAAGAVNILNGVSLAVEPGEAVALLGPSGSGKYSLLMVAAGLEAPTAGRVSVAGRSLTGLSEDALARFRREHVGIVFQSFHLVPTMTALENVAVPLELLRRPDAFARAEAALGSVGLAHRLDHYPGQLSGGEQQRVALARALANNPPIVLADEPTGNLDSRTSVEIMEIFQNLNDKGLTIVLVTHEHDIAQFAKRVLIFRDGKIRKDDAVAGRPNASEVLKTLPTLED
jgi:putative ABC transport system ATP-binding protein